MNYKFGIRNSEFGIWFVKRNASFVIPDKRLRRCGAVKEMMNREFGYM